MNLVSDLFNLATSICQFPYEKLPDPTGRPVVGPCLNLGSRLLPTSLLYGAEMQFHRWRKSIRKTMIRTLFDYRDPATWRRQDTGIDDIMGRFFRRDSPYPALIWVSPVWRRTVNFAIREGLIRKDTEPELLRYEMSSYGHAYVPMVFAGGGPSFGIDITQLAFHYPEKPTFFLRSSRSRILLTERRELVSSAFDDCLILGHPDEERELKRGVYTPNNEFHRVAKDGTSYLDFYTCTMAKLMPVTPRTRSGEASSLSSQSRRSRFVSRPRHPRIERPTDFLDLMGEKSEVKEGCGDARVRFLRFTFHPETMRIVVLLAAERNFRRFLVEHAGLPDLLTQAFAFPGFR